LTFAFLFFAVAAPLLQGADRDPGTVRAAFHRLLERPHGALKPQVSSAAHGGFVEEHGTFFSEETEQVPFLALRKEGAAGRLPVVVVLHGTGGRKEAMRPTLEEMARRGYLAFAIDARYHGAALPAAPTAERNTRTRSCASGRTPGRARPAPSTRSTTTPSTTSGAHSTT
jgi:predicted alpha/beta-fold hydrolase